MRRRVFVLFTLLMSALAFAACSSGAASPPSDALEEAQPVSGGEPIETISVPARWASGSAKDLPTLAVESDVVFHGRVLRLSGQRGEGVPGLTSSGRPGKNDGQAPSEMPISAFEVQVLNPVSDGLAPGSTLTIEQIGGEWHRKDGSRYRVVLEGDEPLEPGAEYLFFTLRRANGTLSAPPYGRFKVVNGALKVPAHWASTGAAEAADGSLLAEVLPLVQQATGR